MTFMYITACVVTYYGVLLQYVTTHCNIIPDLTLTYLHHFLEL